MMDVVKTENDRLRRAGYTQHLIVSVEKNLVKKFNNYPSPVHLSNHKKAAVVPYTYRMGHNLKKAAGKHDVAIALAALKELSC